MKLHLQINFILYTRNISFKHNRNNQYATVRMYSTRFRYETTIDSHGRCNYTECIVNTLQGINENNMQRNYEEQ